MKLSENSRRKIEEFFREHLADESFSLPEIHFYGGKFTHYLTTSLKVEGITVGRRIFIFPGQFHFNEKKLLSLDEELVVHEIAHVLQYRREGFWKFLRLYLKSYRANLKSKTKRDADAKAQAYLEIPFEIEARKIAAEFVAWSRKRKDVGFSVK